MVWVDDTLVGGTITGHMGEVRKLYNEVLKNNEGKDVWTSTKIVGE